MEYTNILIRDLRLGMEIGVGAHEKNRRQPVLVNLVAKVTPPTDWRADAYDQVVCYSTIAEHIRALASNGHIELVETFAEMIAEYVLSVAGVLDVCVKVEKTAVLPDAAAVGVEIKRARSV